MSWSPVSHPVRSAVPTFEPITLDEAKEQLGLQGTGAHDQWILRNITAAREDVERDSMLVCATGTFTTKRTTFGTCDYFELPSSLRPVTAIGSIAYVATDGTSTTWSSSQYSLDTYPKIPIVKLVHGYTWPTLRGDINGITITLTAGYTSRDNVPQKVKDVVLLRLHQKWMLRMEQFREVEMAERAYGWLVESLRPEVYA